MVGVGKRLRKCSEKLNKMFSLKKPGEDKVWNGESVTTFLFLSFMKRIRKLKIRKWKVFKKA